MTPEQRTQCEDAVRVLDLIFTKDAALHDWATGPTEGSTARQAAYARAQRAVHEAISAYGERWGHTR